MRILIAIIIVNIITVFGWNSVYAQSNETKIQLVEKVIKQLEGSFIDIPIGVKRVSIYRLNYDKKILKSEDLNFITAKIEHTFKEFGALTIISPRELEPNNELKIVGRDSSFQISNAKGRSIAESNTTLLIETAEKYAIHGLVELTIQKEYIEGYVFTLKMIRPESQEVIWLKTIASNPIKPKIKKDKGKLTLVSVGVETLNGASYSVNGATTNAEQQVLSYNGSVTVRQPIDSENKGYLGIETGVSYLKGVDDNRYDATLIHLGTSFQHGLGEKKETINANRIAFMLDADVRFALNTYKGSIFTVSSGFNFNFTRSISLGIYARNIISGNKMKESATNKSITFNRLSYGIQCIIRL